MNNKTSKKKGKKENKNRNKNHKSKQEQDFDKIRHEVFKLGLSGFEKKTRVSARVELAIKLGAKPKKWANAPRDEKPGLRTKKTKKTDATDSLDPPRDGAT